MNTFITTFEENKCYCQLKQKFCANANNVEFRANANSIEFRSNVNDLDIEKISECANYEK